MQRRQRGVVVFVVLMFLVMMMMIALYAAQGGLVSERIAGNERDRSVALQAAEAALRDAEASLPRLLAGVPDCDTLFPPNCANGLCGGIFAPPATPLWQTYGANAIPYGRHTGRGPFVIDGRQPSRQPSFLIEFMLRDAEVRGIRVGGGETRRSLFRVWAWGWGNNPNSQVLLEGMFFPPDNFCMQM